MTNSSSSTTEVFLNVRNSTTSTPLHCVPRASAPSFCCQVRLCRYLLTYEYVKRERISSKRPKRRDTCYVTPSTKEKPFSLFSDSLYDPLHTIRFIPETDMLFPCWNSQSFHLHTGGFHVLLHQPCHEQVLPHVHHARPLNGFENGLNLAENRTEYVLLKTWDGNPLFFSANRARPSSQKLPWNGFTEWKFLRNKGKAYQIRE